jgi:hypothetical protein
VVRKDQRYHGSPGNFLDPARLALLSNNSTDSRKPREDVFNRLVKPNTPAEAAQQYPIEPPNMPRLYSGLDPENPKLAEYASLTDFQYTMMSRWAVGEFDADWNGYPIFPPLEQMPLSEQPQALTRATLESCVGSPFYPGIEGTYVIAQAATYESPFRINRNLPPGYLTERMALPWQADFLDCASLWWPAQRPVDVFIQSRVIKPFARGINKYGDMVSSWTELGFIVRRGTEYIETERRPINGED